MPAYKTDITIAIKIGDESFSIHGMKMIDGTFKLKRGRSWSEKMPYATLSQIFDLSRKWAVNHV